MLAIFIAVSSAVAVGVCCSTIAEIGLAWCITWGVITFLLIQITIGLIVRKKINSISVLVQKILTDGQAKLSRKMQHFQRKPQGGMKTMQKILEKDQSVFVREALDATEMLKSYCKWNFLISRQMNSMRMQFYFQLKEYKEVDRLLNKCLYSDPMMAGMKMTRQYLNEDPGLEKSFKKFSKKFKGEQATLIYALYSWALVKRNDIDSAIRILSKAKEGTGSEVLAQNWMNLANGKIKKFSNAGIGDQWYALGLEEPKQVKQRQSRRTAF